MPSASGESGCAGAGDAHDHPVSDPASEDSFYELDLSSHPHDGFFKAVFSDPGKAGAFFRHHLPPDIVSRIEWSTLAVLPSSFVKRDLQQNHSDLLFSALIGGRESLLYLVFEHQSTPDPIMPLRLLNYMVEILLTHTRDHSRPLPLPPVLGFVLHQGPERWSAPTAFEDLFDLPPGSMEALMPYLPKFRHALLDLSCSDPAREEDRADLRMVLQLMKLTRESRLMEFFDWLAAEYSGLSVPPPEGILRLALWYALHSDSSLDVEEIFRHLQAAPQLKHTTMSVAEKLIAKGRADGEARGEARGEAKGSWIGKLQLLEEMMGGPVTPAEALRALSFEELEARYRECQQRYDARFKQVS